MWSFAKVPRSTFSPEENARLLSLYMRPWTLSPTDANADNPLLSELAPYYLLEGYEVGSAGASGLSLELAPSAPQQDGGVSRKRIAKKTPIRKQSYAATWEQHCRGNVISEINRRYIINLLAATCARTVEVPGDSSDESPGTSTVRAQVAASRLMM